ncbi:MAG: tetratricopeptide repeat protein [Puniceicoccales bacterium]|nr:tetratricopeptide repeat protein [Puniceicoccales bacterium]
MTALKHILPSALLAAASMALAATAHAELEWSKRDGWKVKEGTSAKLLPDGFQGTEKEKADLVGIAVQKMNNAWQLQREGDLSDAADILTSIIATYPGTDFAAESYFLLGVIYRREHRFEDGFEVLDELIHRHPEFRHVSSGVELKQNIPGGTNTKPSSELWLSRGFDDVIELQFKIASDIKSGERPYLWGWFPWFRDEAKGLDFFERISNNAPFGALGDKALYEKGNLAVDLDKHEDAIDAFERIISNYPDSKLVPDAYLALARTYAGTVIGAEWDQGATRSALNFYNDFVTLFPTHSSAPVAAENAHKMRDLLSQNRYDLGLFYYETRNNPRAGAIFFNEAINAAPESKTAEDARKKLAEIKAGKLSPRGVMDWIFGRYPLTQEAVYVEDPTQANLENMGFVTERPAAPPPPRSNSAPRTAPWSRPFSEQ